MKTSLHFEAPSDFSVGTVRITGAGETIADWVATPDNRSFERDGVKPGLYFAEIGPAGLAPKSVAFEIREGQANTVVLPTFSALASSGSNFSFFDASRQLAVVKNPFSLDVGKYWQLHPLTVLNPDLSAASEPEKSVTAEPLRQIEISTAQRYLSIGLSEERSGRESFDTFRGQSRIELLAGRLEIELPTDLHGDPWAGHRVRLSVAIQEVRVERCLLPLYRGGTRITVAASPFSPADLEFGIWPVDSKQRALVRALDAGTSDEAAAIRDDVLGNRDPASLLADDADPWAALLVGLLGIRFSNVFSPIDRAWTDRLAEQAGWAFDAHVIRASQALSAAGATPKAKDDAIARAVACLAAAQTAGSPYYRYANELFGEMAAGIASYLKSNTRRVDDTATRAFEKLHQRWYRELPLQRGASSAFTWLARDEAALKERKALVPDRHPSGKLRLRDTRIIFKGQVSAGQISITDGEPNADQPQGTDGIDLSSIAAQTWEAAIVAHPRDAAGPGYPLMPALKRPAGPSDDPNKGRFGGEASRSGYRLTAAFEPAKRPGWTTIILAVTAEPSAEIAVGDVAWFVLHPSFSPPAFKVPFRGNRARLSIQAWGGFTVGVWMPRANVELECDLSELDGAPKNIRLR